MTELQKNTESAPPVSIVMRSKNSDWVIAQALAALFSQTYQDFELLVADSGSTDSTLDIVSHYPGGAGNGAFSVFPIVKHAHRTAGFFKVRGVNINHSEFEDFLFGYAHVQDFKAEIVTVQDLDRLRVSLEFKRGCDESGLSTQIETAIKQTFEVSPEIVPLERGTLAHEFESAVKAPRFQDNRA